VAYIGCGVSTDESVSRSFLNTGPKVVPHLYHSPRVFAKDRENIVQGGIKSFHCSVQIVEIIITRSGIITLTTIGNEPGTGIKADLMSHAQLNPVINNPKRIYKNEPG
jgi:hypothetical protein